jgi:hypothetical protein
MGLEKLKQLMIDYSDSPSLVFAEESLREERQVASVLTTD